MKLSSLCDASPFHQVFKVNLWALHKGVSLIAGLYVESAKMHVTVRHRSVFCACSTKCLTWTVTFAFIAKTYFFSNFTPPAVIKRVEMKSWIGHAKVRLANVAKIGFLHLHWCFWCLKFEYILIYLTPSACFNAESTFDDQFVNWHTKKCQLHILSCFQKVDPFK